MTGQGEGQQQVEVDGKTPPDQRDWLTVTCTDGSKMRLMVTRQANARTVAAEKLTVG